MVAFQKKRIYFEGEYNSPESVAGYQAFLRQHFPFHVIKNPIVLDRKSRAASIVSDVATSFLSWAQSYYPPGRSSGYQNIRSAMKWLLQVCEGESVKTFCPLRLKHIQKVMAADGQSRDYVNQTIGKIKQAFKWAASEEMIPAEVWHGLNTVSGIKKGRMGIREPKRRATLTWDTVAPVLAELSPTITRMILLQWTTGVRSDSLCSATPEQFDRSRDPWHWRPKHKMQFTGKEIIVPIGPKCQELLGDLIDSRAPDEPLFCPRDQRKNLRYGKKYNSVSYRQAIERAIERVNAKRSENGDPPIPHWSPHQLRHAKAQEVRDTYGIEAAQAILTHDSLEATQIYSERRLELAEKVARETG